MVLALLFLIGLAVTPVQSAASALIQGSTASEMRGRVGSVMSTCITLSSVLSMAVAGGLATTLGIRRVFYIAGAIAVLAGLLALPLMREQAAPSSAEG
jgi:sugar phosphate permease